MQLLLFVNIPAEDINIFDSLPDYCPPNVLETFASGVQRYLLEEAQELQDDIGHAAGIVRVYALQRAKNWAIQKNPTVGKCPAPRQWNGVHCGVYTLMAIHHICFDKRMDYNDRLTSGFFRHVLALEIVAQQMCPCPQWSAA